MEIKLEVTYAHLWFEEIMSGDCNEDIEMVWKSLDQAEWYTNVMLEGGQNQERTFQPLDDPEMEQGIKSTINKLIEFRDISKKRLATTKMFPVLELQSISVMMRYLGTLLPKQIKWRPDFCK